jgi:predicted transcriptional regulator
VERNQLLTAHRFRELLAELELTQAEAAEHLGVSVRMVKYYLAGAPMPRVVQLAVLGSMGSADDVMRLWALSARERA